MSQQAEAQGGRAAPRQQRGLELRKIILERTIAENVIPKMPTYLDADNQKFAILTSWVQGQFILFRTSDTRPRRPVADKYTTYPMPKPWPSRLEHMQAL